MLEPSFNAWQIAHASPAVDGKSLEKLSFGFESGNLSMAVTLSRAAMCVEVHKRFSRQILRFKKTVKRHRHAAAPNWVPDADDVVARKIRNRLERRSEICFSFGLGAVDGVFVFGWIGNLCFKFNKVSADQTLHFMGNVPAAACP